MKKNTLIPIEDALNSFLSCISSIERIERLPIEESDGRILSEDIIAPIDYPHYEQCILDGYGVLAADTAGCTESSGTFLAFSKDGCVKSGFCLPAHTGDLLPRGADALLRLEDTTERDGGILASAEVIQNQWVWPKGGGIAEGARVNREGLELKPVDIAMLAKLGISHVNVYAEPKVLIIPTGEECIKRDRPLAPGLVYETNSLMCSLLMKRYGGDPTVYCDIVPDDKTRLEAVLMSATDYDLIVTIGGSSAGGRDLMERVVSSIGKVVFHNVALHPGNHMGAGLIGNGEKNTPVVFLSGYTESCAVGAFVFVDAAVKKLGRRLPARYRSEKAELTGKVTIHPEVRAVRKVNIRNGKAQPIKMLGESEREGRYGYIVIPEGCSGYDIGDIVEVIDFE